MSKQGFQTVRTYAIDGGANGAVAANKIVAMSGVNAGNALVATAGLLGVFGVTMEATDTNGYAPVQVLNGSVAQINSGGAITAGNFVRSNGTGDAVTLTPAAAGAGTLKGVLGIAQTSVTGANLLVDVMLLPQNLFE